MHENRILTVHELHEKEQSLHDITKYTKLKVLKYVEF